MQSCLTVEKGKAMRKFYDLSVKRKAIEMLREKTLKEIAQELGIPEQTVATWKKKYNRHGDAFLAAARIRTPVRIRTESPNVVADLRRHMNISQTELAEMLGVTQSSVARYEKGCFMPKIVKNALNRLLLDEGLPLLP